MKRANDFPEIFIFRDFTDMRKQFMGLAAIAEAYMEMTPKSRALFVFCSKRKDLIKAIYCDGTGFCLWAKKIDSSRFPWLSPRTIEESVSVSAKDLELIFEGVDIFKRHKSLSYERFS